jgi:hypothetical protein
LEDWQMKAQAYHEINFKAAPGEDEGCSVDFDEEMSKPHHMQPRLMQLPDEVKLPGLPAGSDEASWRWKDSRLSLGVSKKQ